MIPLSGKPPAQDLNSQYQGSELMERTILLRPRRKVNTFVSECVTHFFNIEVHLGSREPRKVSAHPVLKPLEARQQIPA